MPTLAANPIRVVELAYDMSLTTAELLPKLVDALTPLVDPNGVLAVHYRLEGYQRRFVPLSVHRHGMPAWLAKIIIGANRLADRAVIEHAYVRAEPLTSFQEMFQNRAPGILMRFPDLARVAPDFRGFNTFDPTGEGVLIGAPLNSRSERYTPAQKARWAQVSAHLSAGIRLRRRLNESPEAIFDTRTSRIVHASGAGKGARERLRNAAVDHDKRKSRDAGDEGIEAWSALVDGRWSLVDVFESDGRRYVVARKNSGLTRDPRALSARQRQVAAWVSLGRSSKETAYHLGISESAVNTHLERAMRRLGLKRRADLVRHVCFEPADLEDVERDEASESAQNDAPAPSRG